MNGWNEDDNARRYWIETGVIAFAGLVILVTLICTCKEWF